MRLLNLHLKNFRQYEDVKIAFRPGVTAMVGPNGAGKTTLLEALAWALYGSPAVRGSNESLRRVNAPARSPVEVSLEFSLGAHRYRVYRRPDRASLYVDDAAAPAHSGLQPVSDAVRQILGMDYRAFFTSYFTGQKDLAFLTGMGKQERATSVGRMLGYERLSRAREKANQERIALDKEIEGLRRGMGDLNDIQTARKSAEDALKTARKELAVAQKRFEKAKGALEALRPKHELSTERKIRYEELETRRGLTEKDRESAQTRIDQCRVELKRLDGLQNELDGIRPQVEQYVKAEREYDAMRPLVKAESARKKLIGQMEEVRKIADQFQARAAGIDAERAKAAVTRGQSAAVKEEIDLKTEEACKQREVWRSELAGLKAQGKSLEDGLKALETRRKRVHDLGEGGECPTCSRTMGSEFDSVMGHFDREAEEIREALRETREKFSAIANEPEILVSIEAAMIRLKQEEDALAVREREENGRLEVMEQAARDLVEQKTLLAQMQQELSRLPEGFDQAKCDELTEIARQTKSAHRRATEIENELKRRPEWSFRTQDAEKEWQMHAERLDEIDKSRKTLKFSPEAHQKLEEEFILSQAEERDAERAMLTCNGDLSRSEGAARSAEAREEEYRRKDELLKELQSRRLYLSTLTEALEKLRLDLNARVRPELADAASEFLDQLTGGRYNRIELNEHYEPFIVDEGERKSVISGGEEDVTHLSLRLAISRMIADRSGQPLSLLVLDEIFGSLDAGRRDNVVGLLQNLKAVFEQIILITHIETIHDMVDQCLWVSYDPATRTSAVSELRGDSPDWGLDLPEAA